MTGNGALRDPKTAEEREPMAVGSPSGKFKGIEVEARFIGIASMSRLECILFVYDVCSCCILMVLRMMSMLSVLYHFPFRYGCDINIDLSSLS